MLHTSESRALVGRNTANQCVGFSFASKFLCFKKPKGPRSSPLSRNSSAGHRPRPGSPSSHPKSSAIGQRISIRGFKVMSQTCPWSTSPWFMQLGLITRDQLLIPNGCAEEISRPTPSAGIIGLYRLTVTEIGILGATSHPCTTAHGCKIVTRAQCREPSRLANRRMLKDVERTKRTRAPKKMVPKKTTALPFTHPILRVETSKNASSHFANARPNHSQGAAS